MPGNSDINGEVLYFDPLPVRTTVTGISNSLSSTELISNLYACNLQTDVLGISIKIQLGLTILLHLELEGIVSIDVIGNSLQLNNADKLPVTLAFVDNTEVTKALDLLESAINGQYINCTDTIITSNLSFSSFSSFAAVSYPCVVFANQIALGVAFNQTDTINLFLNYGQFNFTVVPGMNSFSFTFLYTKEFQSLVPTSIQCLSSFFSCFVNQPTITFNIDYTSSDKFWIYYENKLMEGTTAQIINFTNPSNNHFVLYYVNPYLHLLDLGNSMATQLSSGLPAQLQNLNLLGTNIADLSFIEVLPLLKTFSISQSPSTTINFQGNPLLSSIIIRDSAINNIIGTSDLTVLNSFQGVNINIDSTPDFSSAGTNLKTLEFDGCLLLTSLSSIASNTNLTSYIVNGSSLTVSGLDTTHNEQLRTLVISNSEMMTFSTLIHNTYLSFVDVSSNDLLSSTVESIVAQLAANLLVQSGTLTLSNQTTIIDYTTLGEPFNTNLSYLRNILQWTVNL